MPRWKLRSESTLPLDEMKRQNGFTLIELLVVIAIVAVLMVLVFPVIGRSRKGAQGAVCLGNLRQVASAIQSYANDNNGDYPVGQVGLNIWWFSIADYLGGAEAIKRKGSPLNCAAVHEARRQETGSDLQWPNYGINPFIGNNPWNEPNRPNPMKVVLVRKPSETILVMDGDWNASSPLALITMASPDTHLGGRNILFADGHARWWKDAKNTLNAPPYNKYGTQDIWTP